jgi:hypothetical protein
MQMLEAALFIIAKRWKQPKWSLTEERTNRMWYTDTKWNALKEMMFTHATTWKMLTEADMKEYSMISLRGHIWISKLVETEMITDR